MSAPKRYRKIVIRELLILVGATVIIGLLYYGIERHIANCENRLSVLKEQEKVLNEEIEFTVDKIDSIKTKRVDSIYTLGKVTIEKYATQIKAQYPMYNDMDNRDLVIKFGQEYPEYLSKVVYAGAEIKELDLLKGQDNVIRMRMHELYNQRIFPSEQNAYLRAATIVLAIIIYPLRMLIWLLIILKNRIREGKLDLTFKKRTIYLIIGGLGVLLIITNPTPDNFKNYLPMESDFSFSRDYKYAREYNFLFFSIYYAEFQISPGNIRVHQSTYLGVIKNFIVLKEKSEIKNLGKQQMTTRGATRPGRARR